MKFTRMHRHGSSIIGRPLQRLRVAAMLAAAFSVTGCDSGVPPESGVADAPVAATAGDAQQPSHSPAHTPAEGEQFYCHEITL